MLIILSPDGDVNRDRLGWAESRSHVLVPLRGNGLAIPIHSLNKQRIFQLWASVPLRGNGLATRRIIL